MNNLTLDKIVFPVFKLRSYDKIETIDGITTVYTYWGVYILDNKNLAGDTIGARRVKITTDNVYKLQKVIKSPRALIVGATSKDTYIDNAGRIFSYEKMKNCLVRCYEIKSTVRANSRIIIHLYDHPIPVVVPIAAYDSEYKYVTIVRYGEYYLMYSLEREYVKEFKKKL